MQVLPCSYPQLGAFGKTICESVLSEMGLLALSHDYNALVL